MSTAIYMRVARNDRGQLDTQTQRLHAYAAEYEMAVTAIFFDVGSGIDRDRPGLSGLLDAARAGRFDQLLVSRPDRLARTVRGLAAFSTTSTMPGITLHCADGTGHASPATRRTSREPRR